MMISQEGECKETNYGFLNLFQRTRHLVKGMVKRYKQWKRMEHNLRLLLTMEDRMLKDIGLSRADAVRLSNAQTFWKFMFQPESNGMENQ